MTNLTFRYLELPKITRHCQEASPNSNASKFGCKRSYCQWSRKAFRYLPESRRLHERYTLKFNMWKCPRRWCMYIHDLTFFLSLLSAFYINFVYSAVQWTYFKTRSIIRPSRRFIEFPKRKKLFSPVKDISASW